MTKKEVLNALQISGDINRKDKTDNWIQAFEVYKRESQDYHVSMECGTCYAKVLEWLKK